MSKIFVVRRVTKNGKPYKSAKVKLFWKIEEAKEYIREQEKQYKNKPYFAIYYANAETLFKVLGGE